MLAIGAFRVELSKGLFICSACQGLTIEAQFLWLRRHEWIRRNRMLRPDVAGEKSYKSLSFFLSPCTDTLMAFIYILTYRQLWLYRFSNFIGLDRYKQVVVLSK